MMKHEKETFEFFFCWFCPWNYFSDGSFWMKVRIILCKSVQGLISLYHFDRFAFSSSHKSPSPLHGSCFNAIFEKNVNAIIQFLYFQHDISDIRMRSQMQQFANFIWAPPTQSHAPFYHLSSLGNSKNSSVIVNHTIRHRIIDV